MRGVAHTTPDQKGQPPTSQASGSGSSQGFKRIPEKVILLSPVRLGGRAGLTHIMGSWPRLHTSPSETPPGSSEPGQLSGRRPAGGGRHHTPPWPIEIADRALRCGTSMPRFLPDPGGRTWVGRSWGPEIYWILWVRQGNRVQDPPQTGWLSRWECGHGTRRSRLLRQKARLQHSHGRLTGPGPHQPAKAMVDAHWLEPPEIEPHHRRQVEVGQIAEILQAHPRWTTTRGISHGAGRSEAPPGCGRPQGPPSLPDNPSTLRGGRPPPKRMRGTIEPEQKVRWLNDDRTYAPWQYAEEAMLRSADGQLHVPPATAKEQFHQLPINYTEVDGVSDRSRHRLLGNGWHLGTARFMMMLVLQMVMTTSSTAVPTKPQQSAIQTMMDVMGSFPPAVGPGTWCTEPACAPQADSMWSHWRMACGATHPLAQSPQIEPGWAQCLEVQQLIGGSLNRLRAEIVSEIETLAEERMDSTMTWWQQLPPHIAKVYYNQEHDQISQIPILLELLERTGMPQLEALSQDLRAASQWPESCTQEQDGSHELTNGMSSRWRNRRFNVTTDTIPFPSWRTVGWIPSGKSCSRSSRMKLWRDACRVPIHHPPGGLSTASGSGTMRWCNSRTRRWPSVFVSVWSRRIRSVAAKISGVPDTMLQWWHTMFRTTTTSGHSQPWQWPRATLRHHQRSGLRISTGPTDSSRSRTRTTVTASSWHRKGPWYWDIMH